MVFYVKTISNNKIKWVLKKQPNKKLPLLPDEIFLMIYNLSIDMYMADIKRNGKHPIIRGINLSKIKYILNIYCLSSYYTILPRLNYEKFHKTRYYITIKNVKNIHSLKFNL